MKYVPSEPFEARNFIKVQFRFPSRYRVKYYTQIRPGSEKREKKLFV